MAAKLNPNALLLVTTAAILLSNAASDTVCPYPCYPAGGAYPPPALGANSPPLTGNLPYYQPPPTVYAYAYAPPPPDPILPYFPFYFKNGAHGDRPPAFSSSAALRVEALEIVLASLVISALTFLL